MVKILLVKNQSSCKHNQTHAVERTVYTKTIKLILMKNSTNKTVTTWRNIPNLTSTSNDVVSLNHLFNNTIFTFTDATATIPSKFATVSVSASQTKPNNEFAPTPAQFLKHPIAVVALVPKDAALFIAGAVAGAAAKTVTAPLDRIKLLMQVTALLFFAF